MASPPRIGRARPIVLFVSPGTVEALGPRQQLSSEATRLRLVRFSSDLAMGGDLASYVAGQLASHGIARRPVVVALAPQMMETRILELPDLIGRDLETVVARRAASLCDLEPGEAAFSAVSLDGEDSPERRWLVHAVQRDTLTDFQSEMRARGYPVRSVVSARSALFLSAGVEAASSATGGATLAVLFEREACAIGVLDEGRIVHLSVVPGGSHTHLSDPDAARAFVHELRSIDAFWRRKSRGRSIAGVVVGGVAPSFVDRLHPAIRSALGDVAVNALDQHVDPVVRGSDAPAPAEATTESPAPAEATEASPAPSASEETAVKDLPVAELGPIDRAEESARIAVLDAIRTARLDALDLAIELRPRAKKVLAISVVSALAWGMLAQGVRSELHGTARALENETEIASNAASDLERWRALDGRVQETEAKLRAARDELVEAAGVGLPTDRLVAGLFGALDRDTALLSINAYGPALSPQGSGGSVRIRGVVRDEPGRTAAALARFEERLSGLSCVTTVDMDIPNLSERAGDVIANSTRSLRFSATASLDGRGAKDLGELDYESEEANDPRIGEAVPEGMEAVR
ncbi:MAG: hypothetical protein AAGB93_08950 [Planctomycetota bacterium]